ncbi:unnamed protein product [Brachionus calyciflorus]|uniref:Crossover junction endonuclease MUS81 n=1 Tax=Brachionus calyciflorus TaxID=104777 RepID=A0A814KJT2_9BILA|nr:unnamed protein product [Brachionus calyciflorus]
MFAKCLMKIQGLSQEKVLAIVDLYPSPSHLIKEYSKCSDENSRIKLLANIKYGSAQRNVGPAIGKLVAQLLFTKSTDNSDEINLNVDCVDEHEYQMEIDDDQSDNRFLDSILKTLFHQLTTNIWELT